MKKTNTMIRMISVVLIAIGILMIYQYSALMPSQIERLSRIKDVFDQNALKLRLAMYAHLIFQGVLSILFGIMSCLSIRYNKWINVSLGIGVFGLLLHIFSLSSKFENLHFLCCLFMALLLVCVIGIAKWHKKYWIRMLCGICTFLVMGVVLVPVSRMVDTQIRKSMHVSNEKNEGYAQGTPLYEMDFTEYKYYMIDAYAASLPLLDSITVELPCDIMYYEKKDDTEPVLTLEKGTTVYIHPSLTEFLHIPNSRNLTAYGFTSWPDYEKEWRYAAPFFTEKFDTDDISSDTPMYYVKTDALKQIAKAYYKANTLFQNGTSAYEYVNSCVYSLDYLLYLEGAYCPDFYIYLGSNFR